jgi:non-heme chloroperoxidase
LLSRRANSLAGYSPHDFAADLAAFVDAFGPERAVIAGHSMGSYVAERFAIDYPERTLGLVLLGAFATVADHPAWTGLWQVAAELEDPIDASLVAEFQQSTLAQPVPREFFGLAVQESLEVPAHVWRATIEAFQGADHRTRLSLDFAR